MNLDVYTEKTKSLLQRAQTLSRRKDHQALMPLHILSVLMEEETVAKILSVLKVDEALLSQKLSEALVKLPQVQGAQSYMATETAKLFDRAEDLAKKSGDQFVTVERVFQSVAMTEGTDQILKSVGCDVVRLNDAINHMRKGRTADSPTAEDTLDALRKYAKDLTALAKEGKLDPVIGRDEEIRRTIQVLSRRTKNNPVLIGEPGVGKTAIIEGLALRIVNGDVPDTLLHTQLMSLDLGGLLAGAKYRGEFEERLKAVLDEVSGRDDIVLFIDELHTLMGAGKADGAMDASNMLKPALARGDLHCVGATTLAEYQKHIEKDAAFARRFQPVYVEEPTVEDTISILRGLKEKYERHHGIRITDAAIVSAATLSHRYIANRFLPDKAIDLVDEAASRLRMEVNSKPESIDELDRRIMQLKIEREALKKETDAPSQERLQKLMKELSSLEDESSTLTSAWAAEKSQLVDQQKRQADLDKARTELDQAQRQGNLTRAGELRYGIIPDLERQLSATQEISVQRLLREEVTEEDIASVVAKWTGIPVESMLSSEREKLRQMDSLLQQRVIGQEEAVSAVTQAIRRSRAGLQDPNRPIGSFLFLGPTGVGKTELCKALASFLFDDETAMVRIDMSEYMEKHAVARLLGAPPGYVGYEEGGLLTEAVRRRPYQVILFDEVEKAHPDVFNVLLQVLDDGRLTDGQGRTVDFKNTIIILTSNLGSEFLAQNLQDPEASQGPQAQGHEISPETRAQVMEVVKHAFRPEFLNRLDDILMFRRLSKNHMGGIVAVQLKRLQGILASRGIELIVTDEAQAWLAEKGYDPAYGARPLKRVIQKQVQDLLATEILGGTLNSGQRVQIGVSGDKLFAKTM